MKILQSLSKLIDDESDMYIFEYVLRDDIMKIGLHELKE